MSIKYQYDILALARIQVVIYVNVVGLLYFDATCFLSHTHTSIYLQCIYVFMYTFITDSHPLARVHVVICMLDYFNFICLARTYMYVFTCEHLPTKAVSCSHLYVFVNNQNMIFVYDYQYGISEYTYMYVHVAIYVFAYMKMLMLICVFVQI